MDCSPPAPPIHVDFPGKSNEMGCHLLGQVKNIWEKEKFMKPKTKLIFSIGNYYTALYWVLDIVLGFKLLACGGKILSERNNPP